MESTTAATRNAAAASWVSSIEAASKLDFVGVISAEITRELALLKTRYTKSRLRISPAVIGVVRP
jgi:hypothetical protein